MLNIQALQSAQRALEQESIALGVEKYRAALIAGEDTMPPGMRLIKAAIAPLAAAITEHQEKAHNGMPGRDAGVAKYLTQFSAEQAAFVACRTVLAGITQRMTVQYAALRIAKELEDTINYEKLERENPRAYRQLQKKIKGSSDDGYRHIVMLRQLEYAGLARVKWGTPEKLRLGTLLLHFLIEHTGYATIEKVYRGHGDTPSIVAATAETLEWLQESHAKCELLHPVRMPMVCPPKPWTGPYGGGYLTRALQTPIIKYAKKPYLEELKSVEMPAVYRAINALQETKWAINREILEAAQAIWNEGGRLGKLPPRDPLPLPAQHHDPENDPEAHAAWKREAAKVYQANTSLMSRRVSVAAKLSLAEKFKACEAIYFPHAMDWRGRLYPISATLNPQGDDLTKALLKFGTRKALGEKGAWWLAVHVSNTYGFDKASFDERVQWVKDHEAEILESAANPLDGARFWADADSPFCFLAACFEWARYKAQGDAYESDLPVSWDGTCNGLQNFSAMLRDPIGGAAVNLLPQERPQDIYRRVADAANGIIAIDAADGNEIAQRWAGKLNRKHTKHNTMTLPYGVSRFGMSDQVAKLFKEMAEANDLQAPAPENLMKEAIYIAGKNWEAIGTVVVAARQAMDWLMAAAKVAASDGLPVSWTTPAGLPVLQAYQRLVGTDYDFQVSGQRYRMTVNVEGTELNKSKQASGISPNFVHSLDAAHLMSTVCLCLDHGVTEFAMIHDSYGSHAGDAELLSWCLRRAFVDQYNGDVLRDFRNQLEDQLPPELATELPPLPPMGGLDLEQVMHSRYFFA